MRPSIPTWFEEALEREFRGRFRIRWSGKRKEWHLEQRVGRAVWDAPRVVDPNDDRTIRARDGYAFFAAVQPVPIRPCPVCHLSIPVPYCTFREVRCEYCGYKGLSGRLVLAYFPLGEPLLQHLRSTKLEYTDQNIKALDLHNERLELGLERTAANKRQDALYESMEATSFATAGFPSKAKDFEAGLLKGQD